ncbi:MAG: 4Fe-4S binding protein [Patescibacteria group bacterium]
MFFYLLFFIALFLTPTVASADGGIWMGRFQNWTDGIQWSVVIGFISAILISYFVLRQLLRSLKNIDLLDHFHLRQFVKSRWYPFVFQFPALILFGFIFYYLFFGSYYYSENPASILTWTFWWALLPLSFILVGRIWCAICPFAWISDLAQKYFGKFKRPPGWLVKYSFWIVDAIFLLITWFDRVYGMTQRPFITGLVFVGLLLGVAVCGLLYERRVFCRYVCFLGNVAGTYSMAAPFELKAKNPEICAKCTGKFCFAGQLPDAQGKGAKPSCPFYQVIPSKEGNRFCTLCGNCVKACPHDNISFGLRPFGSDFWKKLYVTFDESFFAKMLVGIVILQNIGMLTLWNSFSDLIKNSTGIQNEKAIFTIAYILSIGIPLLLMFLTSWISTKAGKNLINGIKEKTMQNFARFGYAFVAVDLAGHLAHNFNHFFGEGKTVLAAFAGLFSGEVQQMIFSWLLNYGTVRVMQYIILTLGLIGTFFITYRIAKRTAQTRRQLILTTAPHILLLVALIIFNFYIFSLPMTHRS